MNKLFDTQLHSMDSFGLLGYACHQWGSDLANVKRTECAEEYLSLFMYSMKLCAHYFLVRKHQCLITGLFSFRRNNKSTCKLRIKVFIVSISAWYCGDIRKYTGVIQHLSCQQHRSMCHLLGKINNKHKQVCLPQDLPRIHAQKSHSNIHYFTLG